MATQKGWGGVLEGRGRAQSVRIDVTGRERGRPFWGEENIGPPGPRVSHGEGGQRKSETWGAEKGKRSSSGVIQGEKGDINQPAKREKKIEELQCFGGRSVPCLQKRTALQTKGRAGGFYGKWKISSSQFDVWWGGLGGGKRKGAGDQLALGGGGQMWVGWRHKTGKCPGRVPRLKKKGKKKHLIGGFGWN